MVGDDDMNAMHSLVPSAPASAPSPVERRRRVEAAIAALAPSTRKAYGGAWAAWSRWAEAHDRPELPAGAADVADYLDARHTDGASPATVRMAKAAVSKVHQVSGVADPCADTLVRDTVARLSREGRDRGRGQVAGVGWTATEAAATIAANGGGDLAGLRDAAILRVMSDALMRISEVSALQVSDVRPEGDGGGTVTIRASKTDQTGEGQVRYLGAPTVAAIARWIEAAGVTEGCLFRPVNKAGRVGSGSKLGTDSLRAIVKRRCGALDAISGRIGGHSLRVGSAQALAADGASLVELQQAGGWRSPTTPAVYVRHEAAARGPVARRRYGK